MEEDFGLSMLNEFIRRSLSITNAVVEVLKLECKEIQSLLKPWTVESVLTRTLDETCTCKKVPSTKDQAEEIAADISRALLQAQQLREKLSLNMMKEKKKSREPSVQNIYAPLASLHKNRVQKSGPRVKDINSEPSGSQVKKNSFSKTGSEINKKKLNAPAKLPNPKLSPSSSKLSNNISPKGPTAQSINKSDSGKTARKDFIMANKLSVRNLQKSAEKSGTVPNKSNTAKQSNFTISTKSSEVSSASADLYKKSWACAASTTELDHLIQKMSLRSSENISASCSDIDRSICPLHKSGMSCMIEEKHQRSVDIVEALDIYSVPGEIVKVLKIYHAYLKSVHSGEQSNEKKTKRSIDSFLAEFDKMNEYALNGKSTKPKFGNVLMDSISLYSDTYSGKMNLDHLKNRYIKLEDTFRACDTDKFKFQVPRPVDQKILPKRGWMSNGVWSNFDITIMQEMSKAFCVRYSNKKELVSFFETLQRLQQSEYLKDLIKLIMEHVIPRLNSFPDKASSEYALAYKMLFILCQGLNPQIPVLVRTDK